MNNFLKGLGSAIGASIGITAYTSVVLLFGAALGYVVKELDEERQTEATEESEGE